MTAARALIVLVGLLTACGRIGFVSVARDAAGDADQDASVDLGADALADTSSHGPGSVLVTPTTGLSTSETGAAATFSIQLSDAPTADVTIAISCSDESEGTVAPSSVTFTADNWNAPQIVTVTGVDDELVDGNQGYVVSTLPASSLDADYSGVDAPDVAVTNIDNERAGVTFSRTAGLVTSESGGFDTFTVSLNTMPSGFVVIPLSVDARGEATLDRASLTFTPTNWSSAQMVTVTGVDDAMIDGDRAFTVITGEVASPDGDYSILDVADVVGVNRDNESPGILVAPMGPTTTTENRDTTTFSIALQSQPSDDVTIALASSDLSEGIVSVTSLTLTPANWNSLHIITVTGVNDSAIDGDQPYVVHVGPATSADVNYMGLVGPDVMLTNLDNERAGIVTTGPMPLTTTEGAGTALLRVRLLSAPDTDVGLHVTSSRESEGIVGPADLTFTSANWNINQTVTLTGVDDLVADGDQDYEILLHVSPLSDANYLGVADLHVAARNTDDESAGFVVTPTTGLVTTEGGGTATFAMRLNSEPTADVTTTIASDRAAEGTVSPSTLTFTPANWTTFQTVTITGVDDSASDGDQVFHVVTGAATSADPEYNGINPADITVSNSDDEAGGILVTPTSGLITTEGGDWDTFTLVLTSHPSADVLITVTSSDTTEGYASTTVTFTPSNWSTPQTVNVTGANDGFDDGDVAYTVVTSAATSTDPRFSLLSVPDVSATNIDDDTAGLTVVPIVGNNTSENGDDIVVSVRSTSTSVGQVNVVFSISDPSEAYISAGEMISTSAVVPQLEFFVQVAGLDDALLDGDTPYTLNAVVTSSDGSYNGLVIPPISLTNLDNDSASDILVTSHGPLVVTEYGSTSRGQIVLTRAPSSDVTVGLSANDATEAAVSPASVTFTPANWATPRDVTATGVGDGVVDGDQSTLIVTAAATSADGSFAGINPADFSVLTIDRQMGRCASVSATTGLPSTVYSSGRISADGRFVVFDSYSSDFVAGDSNNSTDTFLRDRLSGTTSRVNVSSAGVQSSGNSSQSQMNADGRYVVFGSDSTTLVPGDTNGAGDIFMRDTMLNTTTRVSVSDSGSELNAQSFGASISDTGRFIAFYSYASNAVLGDTNGAADVFVRDLMLGTTSRVNLTSAGLQSAGGGETAVVSADGRYVAFGSSAPLVAADTNTFQDVYVRDRVMNTTTLVSVGLDGGVAYYGAYYPDITPDGRYILFNSDGPNFVVGDSNGFNDVFVRDMMTNTTTRISVGAAAAQSNNVSFFGALSDDGQRVVFDSHASNLVAGDANHTMDVFVRDIAAGTTTMVSSSPLGALASLRSGNSPTISADGHSVCFSTEDRNIVTRDYVPVSTSSVYVVAVP